MLVFSSWLYSTTDRFKQWLTPPDPSTNFNDAVKSHFSNTGSWLLNSAEYEEWKKKDNSFIWILGICKYKALFSVLYLI